jgi:hypothetical protein
MSEDFTNISWTPQLEQHFASTGEKANCLAWCHKKAEEKYSKLRTFIDLPVITLSSICGFLQIGSDQMFPNPHTSSVALGLLSLFVAILSTTQTYFKWSARAEAHRISAIQYNRLYRFISIEMNLPRQERKAPQDLLKDTKDSYDRLQEISPLIPSDITNQFKRNFEKLTSISKPEETNGIEKIQIYTENPLRKVESYIDGTPRESNPERNKATGQASIKTEIQTTETPSNIYAPG